MSTDAINQFLQNLENAGSGLTFVKRLRIRKTESAYIYTEKRTAGSVGLDNKKENRSGNLR
jgi:hypothetical protein